MTTLIDIDLKHIWHPFTQMAHHQADILPLVPIVGARGALLRAADGRTLIDGVSSWWTNTIGHCHPRVIEAVSEQIATLDHVMFANFTHAPAQKLTALLLEITPPPLANVLFSDNGSTAVEAALKLALQYWKNLGRRDADTFVTLAHAYHGDTAGAMSVSDTDQYHQHFDPIRFKTLRFSPGPRFWAEGDARRVDDETAAAEDLANFRYLMKRHHKRVAALFIEPLVLGAGGMRMYAPARLAAMIQIAREYGALVIVDEVMTGFGRTGALFAINHLAHSLCPDMICLSKGITGGALPLGVTMTQNHVFEAFLEEGFEHRRTFFHGHSYTANPVICRAAHAAISALLEEQLIERAAAFYPTRDAWAHRIANAGLPLSRIRHFGNIFAMEAAIPPRAREPFSYQIFKIALERGALIRPIGNIVYLMPPLCASEDELNRLFDILLQSLSQYYEGQEPPL